MWMTREQIIVAVGGRVEVAPIAPNVEVRKLVWDSRLVEEGCAFLAIVGERVDGNAFVPAAIEAGISCALLTSAPSDELLAAAKARDVALVRIDDPVLALQKLAAKTRDALEKQGATVIGISGSSGKTTTKDLVAAVLGAQFETVATAANQNNELGVPNTVLAATPDTQMLVVEMGMRGLGQLEELCAFVRPYVGLITNIGTAHEELLGSQDNIARAKAELIEALPDYLGIAVLNGDDPYTPFIREHACVDRRGIRVLEFGLREGCAVRGQDVSYDEAGRPSFTIAFPNGREGKVRLPLMGAHNVMNALAAAAVGFACDMPIERICNALARVRGGALRQEVRHAACGAVVIDDTYNANPDSMRAALELLHVRECAGRRIAVLGDMGELGEREIEAHRSVGAMAAQCGVDLLIAVGVLAHHIAAGAQEAGMDAHDIIECNDGDAALEALSGLLTAEDAVLVKASRFMRLEHVARGLEQQC